MSSRFLFLVLLYLPVAAAFPQRPPRTSSSVDHIDSLKTDEEILTFMHGFHFSYADYSGLTYRQRADSLGAKAYEKADLDHNGLTDLLFNGYDTSGRRWVTLVVMSFRSDSFSVIELGREQHPEFFAARVIHIDGQPFVQSLTVYKDSLYYKHRFDTVTWLLGYTIERPTGQYSIDTLRFQLGDPFGLRGLLEMTIVHDDVRLRKSCDPHPFTAVDSGGIFVSKLDGATANCLHALLGYIDWESLEKSYRLNDSGVSWSDIEVRYDHGKRRSVYDFGLSGTYGLIALEDMLMGVFLRQTWKRIGKGGLGFNIAQGLY